MITHTYICNLCRNVLPSGELDDSKGWTLRFNESDLTRFDVHDKCTPDAFMHICCPCMERLKNTDFHKKEEHTANDWDHSIDLDMG